MPTLKIRFEVFKRDDFRCQYCGKRPPDTILEADHIQPLTEGGPDEINNIITSCFDCNRGKKDIPLQRITPSIEENLLTIKEKERQLHEYHEYLRLLSKKQDRAVSKVEKVFQHYHKDRAFTFTFKSSSIKKFLGRLPLPEVIEAMHIGGEKFPSNPDRCLSYFCGVCWRKIRDAEQDNS